MSVVGHMACMREEGHAGQCVASERFYDPWPRITYLEAALAAEKRYHEAFKTQCVTNINEIERLEAALQQAHQALGTDGHAYLEAIQVLSTTQQELQQAREAVKTWQQQAQTWPDDYLNVDRRAEQVETALTEAQRESKSLRDECIRLSRVISRVDYALGPPNEMECSLYDVDVDDERVVRMVTGAQARAADFWEQRNLFMQERDAKNTELFQLIDLLQRASGRLGTPEQLVDHIKRQLTEAQGKAALATLAEEVHEFAVSRSWWKDDLNHRVLRLLDWIIEEVEEAREAWQTHGLASWTTEDEEGQLKPEGFRTELFDIFGILMDLALGTETDVPQEGTIKMAYNRVRKYRRDYKGDALTAPATEANDG